MDQQFVTVIHTELTVPLTRKQIGLRFFSGDHQANRIIVEVYKNHKLQMLEGEVTGFVVRDNLTLVTIPGGIEDGKAFIDVPEDANAVCGTSTIHIQLKNESFKITIAELEAYVDHYIPEEADAHETNIRIVNAPYIYVDGDTMFVQSQAN